MSRSDVLTPGRNCWRIAGATRVAFLVDAASYFAAVRTAMQEARESILVLAWDIDSRARLVEEDQSDGWPIYLGEFLNAVVSRRRGLHAHVLAWDYATLFALEREWFPQYLRGWRTHRRLHFRLDGVHPPGASHHQKVVVIDDRLAFLGGLDLTRRRWDTPAHEPGDPRRRDPDGVAYSPFHDVQVMVAGDAAAVLGDLARERWRRAGGSAIPPPTRNPGLLWPEDVPPDLEDVPVAIARTIPSGNGGKVREVERLHLDLIREAQDAIYIENQYFTSITLCQALADRLREPRGPEIVMVLPRETGGWLEQSTMDALRSQCVARLREADRHGRLRLYYPWQPGLDPACINLHSKVLIADDRYVRVGSSNLSTRSMSLDTECDLAIGASEDQAGVQAAIGRFRSRLLAEHLGVPPTAVEGALRETSSLVAAIESLRGSGRSLRELQIKPSSVTGPQLVSAEVADPERALSADLCVEQFVSREQRRPARSLAIRFAALLLGVLALAGAWRWSGVDAWVAQQGIARAMVLLYDNPLAPLLVIGAYVAGGLVVAPVTLMIVATATIFGPVFGFVYSLLGVLCSAACTFGIGRTVGGGMVRRLAGHRIHRLNQWLGRRGLLAMLGVRMVPVAPFTVVNLAAGASRVRFRDYMLGTAAGMTPGMVALCVSTDVVWAALLNPSAATVAALFGIGALCLSAAWAFSRWVRLDGGAKRA